MALADQGACLHGGLYLPLRPGEPKVLGAHMLEVRPSIAADVPSCEIHPLSIGNREDPVRWYLTALLDPRSWSGSPIGSASRPMRWRSCRRKSPCLGLPVARAVWKTLPNLSTSRESWVLAGGPHHTVLSSAVDIKSLIDFADVTKTELSVINAETTVRQFAKELRWNQAHHRLAQAL